MLLVFIPLLLLFGVTVYIHSLNRKLNKTAKSVAINTQREQAEKRVLDLLFNNAPLTEILDAIVKSAEIQNPNTRCAIFLVSADGKHLRLGSAGSLSAFFQNSIGDIEITASSSTCALTALTGKRSLIDNIQTDASCPQCKNVAGKNDFASCWSEPIKAANGKPLGVLAFYHHNTFTPSDTDIALIEKTASLISIVLEKIQNAAALEQSHTLLSKISAEIPGIIFQLRMAPDGKLSFPFISESARKIYGVKPEVVREDASPIFSLHHPEDSRRVLASINESARSLTPWNIEFRDTIPMQGVRWRLGKAQPEKLADNSIIWHGFIADITDSKSAEERIRHMAQYDQLTDLPNRALFSDRLQQAVATAKREQTRIALLFIDFDKFKPINDNLGHAVGDILLKRAASRMQSCMRESDTIARLGGDEFVTLVPAIESAQDAQLVAEKIRLSLETPFEIEGNQLKISVSIGIAIYPEQGENEIELSKHADIAMYYAKNNGRNNIVIYENSMHVPGQ